MALVAAAFIDVYAFALVAMLFVGFGAIGMAATANTTIQLAVPDELRGRVISVYTTVFVGSTPLGGLLMGWIASAVSVEASLVVGGVGCLVVGSLSLAWLRRIRGAALLAPGGSTRQPSSGGAPAAPSGSA